MKRTCFTCVNCNHSSLVRSNFKLTLTGKAYCIKNERCVEKYEQLICNSGARQKGEKVE